MASTGILKGSMLMVFVGGSAIAFATSHSLSVTTNTTEVSTKDHGAYPSVVANTISWEVTTENLCSDSAANASALLALMKAKEPVTVKFALVSNWDDNGLSSVSGAQGVQAWTAGTALAEGQAIITSLQVNAPAGDNATMSATFTGTGTLDQSVSGTQGVQGAQA